MQFKWFTQNTQSLRNFRGVDHPEIFEHLLPFGKYAFLLTVRKFYAKYAKFTQKTQNLRKNAKFTQNTQKKPSLKYTNFTQNLRKLRNVTQKNFA